MKNNSNQNLIRCFIAVELPPSIKNSLFEFLDRLKPISKSIKWVNPSGIHITLKFLGEIEPSEVKKVSGELQRIKGIVNPFELKISGNGAFPNKRRPRVFWLGLQQDEQRSLFRLHQWIDEQLEALGFEKEKRRFSPHLTLGRVKYPEDFSNVFDYLKDHPFEPDTLNVEEIVFMRSELKPTGAEYTVIQSYKLGL